MDDDIVQNFKTEASAIVENYLRAVACEEASIARREIALAERVARREAARARAEKVCRMETSRAERAIHKACIAEEKAVPTNKFVDRRVEAIIVKQQCRYFRIKSRMWFTKEAA